jgi:hypothetical protein
VILRRVIEHVKAQNWMAVILDFFIVVAGILIAFQITNWNERRAERARAISYLERLDDDLAADVDIYRRRGLALWKEVSEYGGVAIDYADNDEMGDKTYWQLLVAFFQASQTDVFSVTQPTYDEMTSAGELALIGDVALRKALSIYYSNSYFQALSESPDYRKHVRSVIPVDIQTYIWNACFGSDPYQGQTMIDCDASVSEDRAKEIVDALAGDAVLISELRYWLSTLQVATIIANDRIEFAENLRSAIAVELGTAQEEDNPFKEDKEVVETAL